ncbi:MAG: hypothetical protein FWB74_05450 [Defluviitaleaceae bacterium]|nr:hypothetical protein [Defluviitaleaceae bacterium]
MINHERLPDIMYFGASKQMSELKGEVFLSPHIGIASCFVIDVDDLFGQFPKGYDYKCNISYRQWDYPNELLQEPLETINASHNIVELKSGVFEGESSGYIHVVDISSVKDKLSLFTTNNQDREVIYRGDEPLVIIKRVPCTVKWDFGFSEADVEIHGVGIMKKQENIDKRGILDDEIFSYRITKDKKVFISYEGKQVTTLSGKKADEFIRKIENAKVKEAQLIMAKVTGNFKRGNEKLFKKK